ncbi:S9 family peptidase [Natrononativus amylolyticus]|uniref:S9 family peptidase n=1 Tax=Natrononativus amylolyticus TaxID=2963434 RepID=UPI0020CFA9D0|nr:prolyl oligopeptidase family serine peptidase [Natrononativus amylolyticus]
MLTVDDVLDLEWPGPPAWSTDSAFLGATIYEDDGNALLVSRPGDDGDPWRVRPNDAHVTEFAWSPTDPVLVCGTDDGAMVLLDPLERTITELARTPDGDGSFAWSDDGDRIAFYRDGCPWIRSLADGIERGFDVPERGPFLGESRMLAPREDGLLAYRFVEREAKCVGVIDTDSGELVWRTRPDTSSHSPVWLADGRLLFERSGEYGTVREFVAADLEGGETTLFREEDGEVGTLSRGSPQVSPDGSNLAAAFPLDGFEHVYVIDLESGERTQLTAGAFEDKGFAGSAPRWLDDETLVFASNRRDPGQRQLYAVTLEGEITPLVEREGTAVDPRPSPDGSRLAYRHASAERSTELRVLDLEGGATPTGDGETAAGTAAADDGVRDRRLTRSGVESWPSPPTEPERISYESSGLTVEGYLLDPRRGEAVPDDATDLPSVVYVHGGPMRQMRDGFHPERSYGLQYAIQQYLAAKGYVGLFVNYRGGIGYGREFRAAIAGVTGRAEMDDIARGADFLRGLEYTSDAVGLWGLSYGGYAALQLPGTHPGTFDVTVNLAGLVDRANYYEWAAETKFPEIASATSVRMGGTPLEAPERWADSSPITHVDRYETPLYNFHGTADRYVNVEQQDLVVDALLDSDVAFEAEYYPDEGHVFSRRATWARTIEKLEGAFETHLR